MKVEIGSTAFRTRRDFDYVLPKVKRGCNRTKISKFTAQSRRALNWHLGTLDYIELRKQGFGVFFITLTYQKDFYQQFKDPEKCKNDLDNLFKSFSNQIRLAKEKFPMLSIEWFTIWKMEFQQNGSLHYHLILFFRGHSVMNLINYFSEKWAYIITLNTGVDKVARAQFERSGTQVKTINTVDDYNERVLTIYLAKEVGKVNQTGSNFCGRWWGIINRKDYERFRNIQSFEIQDLKVFVKVNRILIKYYKRKIKTTSGRNYNFGSCSAGFTAVYLPFSCTDGLKAMMKRLIEYYSKENSTNIRLWKRTKITQNT